MRAANQLIDFERDLDVLTNQYQFLIFFYHKFLCNILLCRCMQKHIQHNKDEWTQFFIKNIPLTLFERVRKGYERYYLWEVSWRVNRTATYWPPPTLLPTAAFLSCSPGLLDRRPGGLGAQLLLGHGSHSSIFSPTDLNFLSPGLYNNLTSTYFWGASQFALNSTLRQSRMPPWYLRPDAPVIYTGAFLLLTAWPGSICYIWWNIGLCNTVAPIREIFLNWIFVWWLRLDNVGEKLHTIFKKVG